MISAKKYVPHWSRQVSVIKKVKNTVLWTYLIEDLNGEEIIGTFCERELQKTNLKEFRIKKVIKTKSKDYMLNGKVATYFLTVGLKKR